MTLHSLFPRYAVLLEREARACGWFQNHVVTYLAGHNRPIHEVLFGNDKEITKEFQNNFVGMTTQPVELKSLLWARTRLRAELHKLLTHRQREFLIGLAYAKPDWSFLACPHAAELPALRWKLTNLETFAASRPEEFLRQAQILESQLSKV